MATAKTTTLTFLIEPNIKEALCTAADRDHRSIANMVAVMIREHSARVGITIQDKQATPAHSSLGRYVEKYFGSLFGAHCRPASRYCARVINGGIFGGTLIFVNQKF